MSNFINIENMMKSINEASDEQMYMNLDQVKKNQQKRRNVQTIGIECEYVSNAGDDEAEEFITENGIRSWQAVYDASVNGFELKNTKPLKFNTLDFALEELDYIRNNIKYDMDVDSSTGVHIHFGLSPNVQYTSLDLIRLMINANERGDEIEQMAGREFNQYSKSMSTVYNKFSSELYDILKEYMDNKESVKSPSVDYGHLVNIIKSPLKRNVDGLREKFNAALELYRNDIIFKSDDGNAAKEFVTFLIDCGFSKLKPNNETDEDDEFNNVYDKYGSLVKMLSKHIDKLDSTGATSREIVDAEYVHDALKNAIYIFTNKQILLNSVDAVKKFLVNDKLNRNIEQLYNPSISSEWDSFKKLVLSVISSNEYSNYNTAADYILSGDYVDALEYMEFFINKDLNENSIYVKRMERALLVRTTQHISENIKRDPIKIAETRFSLNEWFSGPESGHYNGRRYWGVNVNNIGGIHQDWGDVNDRINTVELRWGSGLLGMDSTVLKQYIEYCYNLLNESFTGDRTLTFKKFILKDVQAGSGQKQLVHVFTNIDNEPRLIGQIYFDNLAQDLHKPRSEKVTGGISTEAYKDGNKNFIKSEISRIISDKNIFKEYVKTLLKDAKYVDSLKNSPKIGNSHYNKIIQSIKRGNKDILDTIKNTIKGEYEIFKMLESKYGIENQDDLIGKFFRVQNWPEGKYAQIDRITTIESVPMIVSNNTYTKLSGVEFKDDVSDSNKISLINFKSLPSTEKGQYKVYRDGKYTGYKFVPNMGMKKVDDMGYDINDLEFTFIDGTSDESLINSDGAKLVYEQFSKELFHKKVWKVSKYFDDIYNKNLYITFFKDGQFLSTPQPTTRGRREVLPYALIESDISFSDAVKKFIESDFNLYLIKNGNLYEVYDCTDTDIIIDGGNTIPLNDNDYYIIEKDSLIDKFYASTYNDIFDKYPIYLNDNNLLWIENPKITEALRIDQDTYSVDMINYNDRDVDENISIVSNYSRRTHSTGISLKYISMYKEKNNISNYINSRVSVVTSPDNPSVKQGIVTKIKDNNFFIDIPDDNETIMVKLPNELLWFNDDNIAVIPNVELG